MIIKCPKCENNFLAPDDLEEGQDLQCGKCNHTWKLEQKIKEMPEAIKPQKPENKSVKEKKKIKKSKPEKKGSGFGALLVFIILVGILGFGAMTFREKVINTVPETARGFELIDFLTSSKEEKFALQKLRAREQDDKIVLTGFVINKTNFKAKTPKIRVADSIYIEAQNSMLCGGCSTVFQATLPKTLENKIKVSF